MLRPIQPGFCYCYFGAPLSNTPLPPCTCQVSKVCFLFRWGNEIGRRWWREKRSTLSFLSKDQCLSRKLSMLTLRRLKYWLFILLIDRMANPAGKDTSDSNCSSNTGVSHWIVKGIAQGMTEAALKQNEAPNRVKSLAFPFWEWRCLQGLDQSMNPLLI